MEGFSEKEKRANDLLVKYSLEMKNYDAKYERSGKHRKDKMQLNFDSFMFECKKFFLFQDEFIRPKSCFSRFYPDIDDEYPTYLVDKLEEEENRLMQEAIEQNYMEYLRKIAKEYKRIK